jgi:hypothetical protein
VVRADLPLVGLADLVVGPRLFELGEDGVYVDPDRLECLPDDGRFADVTALVMSGREQRLMRVEELVRDLSRTTTPAFSANRSGALSGVSQTDGSPSATWLWVNEKGAKVTSQSAPAFRAVTRCSWALRAKGQR